MQPSPFTPKLGTNYAPSDSEVEQLKQLMSGPQQRISNVDSELAALRQSMEKLEGEKRQLSAYVDAHSALISPVRRLPVDVIREIFLACLPTARNCVMSTTEAPLLLGRVCSSWRDISLSTPRLWSKLHIVHPTSVSYHNYGGAPDLSKDRARLAKRIHATKIWLGRAGECPLSISYDVDHACMSPAAIIDLLVLYAYRWHTIDMLITSEGVARLMELTEQDVPMLTSVTLKPIMATASPPMLLGPNQFLNFNVGPPVAAGPGPGPIFNLVPAPGQGPVPAPPAPPPPPGPAAGGVNAAAVQAAAAFNGLINWGAPANQRASPPDWTQLRLLHGARVRRFGISSSSVVPFGLPLRWEQLTSLSVLSPGRVSAAFNLMAIGSTTDLPEPNANLILRTLAECPQLRHCKLTVRDVDETLFDGEIYMPHLQTLELHFYRTSIVTDPFRLLRHLSAPNLRSFAIRSSSSSAFQDPSAPGKTIAKSVLQLLAGTPVLEQAHFFAEIPASGVQSLLHALPATVTNLILHDMSHTLAFQQAQPATTGPALPSMPAIVFQELISDGDPSLNILPSLSFLSVSTFDMAPDLLLQKCILSRAGHGLRQVFGRFGRPLAYNIATLPEMKPFVQSGSLKLMFEYVPDNMAAMEDSPWRGLPDAPAPKGHPHHHHHHHSQPHLHSYDMEEGEEDWIDPSV
ncbi:unnamed protein product [Mycena citricolor]|uniref:F-box domain-containing protein n=1 Tax=Mycena citricolor TaxID=2018698 RepID=A0AAD2HCG6_9AGAR|nr:unnamed protein product [Mycena citricolor]